MIAGLMAWLNSGPEANRYISTVMPTVPEEARTPPVFVRERPDLTAAQEYAGRAANLPGWFAWGPFVPLRFVAGLGTIGPILNNVVGGLTAALVAVAAWRGARRGRWLLAGVAGYVLALCVLWPHVNNRYVVPVLPFLIGGVFEGLDVLRGGAKRGFRGGVARVLKLAFVAAVLFVNGFMWSVDAWIARSPTAVDFYSRYEAGVHLSLIEAAAELRKRADAHEPGVVAASERYENLRERWNYKTSPRVLALPRRRRRQGRSGRPHRPRGQEAPAVVPRPRRRVLRPPVPHRSGADLALPAHARPTRNRDERPPAGPAGGRAWRSSSSTG